MITKQSQTNKANHIRQGEQTTLKRETALPNVKKQQGDIGQRLDEKTAHVSDTRNCLVNKRGQARQRAQATSTHIRYALHQGKEDVTHNVADFKQSMADTKTQRKQQRMNQQEQKRKNIAQKHLELDKVEEKR